MHHWSSGFLLRFHWRHQNMNIIQIQKGQTQCDHLHFFLWMVQFFFGENHLCVRYHKELTNVTCWCKAIGACDSHVTQVYNCAKSSLNRTEQGDWTSGAWQNAALDVGHCQVIFVCESFIYLVLATFSWDMIIFSFLHKFSTFRWCEGRLLLSACSYDVPQHFNKVWTDCRQTWVYPQ